MFPVALVLVALTGPPTLSTGVVESDANKLVEIRIEAEDGVAGYEWLVLDTSVDWRQYDNGKVFVATAPPGEYQARLRVQRIDWEKKSWSSEWRVYTIRVRGPPEPVAPVLPEPPTPDPTTPGSLTGPVYAIAIRKSTELDADQSTALLRIRTWVDQQASERFQFLQYHPEAVNGDGSANASVAAYVAKIPADASMPYVFIVQRKKTGGSFIHWQGELLSAEQVIDSLQGAKR